MNRDKLTDSLKQCFRIAFLLNRRDRGRAKRLLRNAVLTLQEPIRRQRRRLRNPAERRRRAILSRAQQIQLQLFAASEDSERRDETNELHTLTTEDLLLRYLKLLVYHSLLHDSFYGTVAITRFVYSYSTADTLAVQGFFSARGRDAPSCRRVKRALLETVVDRFGEFVEVVQGPRGVHMLAADPNPQRWALFVDRGLWELVPAGTECLLPEPLDPHSSIPGLHHRVPSQAHAIETARLHAVIDPPCFRRLAEAVGLGPPDERLCVPHFSLGNEGPPEDPPVTPPTPTDITPLSPDELAELISDVEVIEKLRARTCSRSVRVKIDGVEWASWDLDRTRSFRLEAPAHSRALQIVAEEQNAEYPLVSLLLLRPGRAASGEGQVLEVPISRERFAFRFLNQPTEERDSLTTFHLEIEHSEPRLGRRLRRFVRRFWAASDTRTATAFPFRWALPTLAAFLLMIATVIGIVWATKVGPALLDRPASTRQAEVITAAPVEIVQLSSRAPRGVAATASVPHGSVLVLLIDDSHSRWASYRTFQLVLRPEEGETASPDITIPNLTVSPNGYLAAAVPASDLDSGKYKVHLYGITAAAEPPVELAAYELMVHPDR